jgi:hypothetical protein
MFDTTRDGLHSTLLVSEIVHIRRPALAIQKMALENSVKSVLMTCQVLNALSKHQKRPKTRDLAKVEVGGLTRTYCTQYTRGTIRPSAILN